MSFPPATEMVQFAGFASSSYGFTEGYPLGGGLPHSEIRGSTGARPSPRLFAACHVLHRLSVPRHPPDALLVKLAHAQPQARQEARAENRRPRTDQDAGIPDLSFCSLVSVTCPLEPSVSITDACASAIAYPCPGPARRNGWTCFTVTTRFTISREQRTEIREQTGRSIAHLRHNSRSPMPERHVQRPSDLCPLSSVIGTWWAWADFERPTSRLSGVRSNQLSYRPVQRTESRDQMTDQTGRRTRRLSILSVLCPLFSVL